MKDFATRFLVILLAVVLIGVVCGGSPALAQTSTTFNDLGGDNHWHTPANWSFGVPTASLRAIIPNHDPVFTCVIHRSQGNAFAKTIEVGAGATLILDGQNLTIGEDGFTHTSNVDGLVTIHNGEMNANSQLRISGDHTIKGDGGTINLTQTDDARIQQANDNQDLLIINGSCGDGPDLRGCSLSITGQGDIRVQLDNNAFVVADVDNFGKLKLTGRAKTTTGVGFWIAENGGLLDVETTVTGAGEWQVFDVSCDGGGGQCDGCIRLLDGTNGCVSGTGRVLLKAGFNEEDHQLKVEGDLDFCTTGKLVWQSIAGTEGGGTFVSAPTIVVWSDASATFGGACGACP